MAKFAYYFQEFHSSPPKTLHNEWKNGKFDAQGRAGSYLEVGHNRANGDIPWVKKNTSPSESHPK